MTLLPLRAIALPEIRPQPVPWSLTLTAGRLVEVTGGEDSAAFTMACRLILDAQQEGEQAAWIASAESLFFAPDLHESGIDLDALVVVRVPGAAAGARTADKLIRSGAFGLVVVDAGAAPGIPTPLLARLASLAQRHHAALIFLTQQHRPMPSGPAASSSTVGTSSSLGSLISLRVRARRQRIARDRFRCWLEVLKDKRRGPTWGHDEVCRGAPGMR
jgi:recombination protein RecA